MFGLLVPAIAFMVFYWFASIFPFMKMGGSKSAKISLTSASPTWRPTIRFHDMADKSAANISHHVQLMRVLSSLLSA
jgi:hypothetical protein